YVSAALHLAVRSAASLERGIDRWGENIDSDAQLLSDSQSGREARLEHRLLVERWPRRGFFFFLAEDGIRDRNVTGVQTCALAISARNACPRVGNLNPGWFDPKYWEERGELDGAARGRGTTHFVKSAGRHFVLRHYRRGGLIEIGRASWRERAADSERVKGRK